MHLSELECSLLSQSWGRLWYLEKPCWACSTGYHTICSTPILDSLIPPAADVVRSLGSQALPTAYLEQLDSAFGTVEDGDELFAQVLNTLQDAGDKPSHNLHRLQIVLTKTFKRGGVSASEADWHLLRQFCRGCWDNAFIPEKRIIFHHSQSYCCSYMWRRISTLLKRAKWESIFGQQGKT